MAGSGLDAAARPFLCSELSRSPTEETVMNDPGLTESERLSNQITIAALTHSNAIMTILLALERKGQLTAADLASMRTDFAALASRQPAQHDHDLQRFQDAMIAGYLAAFVATR